MVRRFLKAGAVAALLLAPVAGAHADDPTGVMLQMQGAAPAYPGPLPEFTEGGVCYRGMHSQAYNNAYGYRCVRDR